MKTSEICSFVEVFKHVHSSSNWHSRNDICLAKIFTFAPSQRTLNYMSMNEIEWKSNIILISYFYTHAKIENESKEQLDGEKKTKLINPKWWIRRFFRIPYEFCHEIEAKKTRKINSRPEISSLSFQPIHMQKSQTTIFHRHYSSKPSETLIWWMTIAKTTTKRTEKNWKSFVIITNGTNYLMEFFIFVDIRRN